MVFSLDSFGVSTTMFFILHARSPKLISARNWQDCAFTIFPQFCPSYLHTSLSLPHHPWNFKQLSAAFAGGFPAHSYSEQRSGLATSMQTYQVFKYWNMFVLVGKQHVPQRPWYPPYSCSPNPSPRNSDPASNKLTAGTAGGLKDCSSAAIFDWLFKNPTIFTLYYSPPPLLRYYWHIKLSIFKVMIWYKCTL